jgi:hypothetical protein
MLVLVTGGTALARRTHDRGLRHTCLPPNVIRVGRWQHPELTRVSAMSRRPSTSTLDSGHLYAPAERMVMRLIT